MKKLQTRINRWYILFIIHGLTANLLGQDLNEQELNEIVVSTIDQNYENIVTVDENEAKTLDDLNLKINQYSSQEFEAQLNKVMDSSAVLRNKSMNEIRVRSAISNGSTLIKDIDHIEFHLLKNNTNLTDDAIDNNMLGKRAFILSTVALAAVSSPASVPAFIAGTMIYSMYRLQDRINFRENYRKDPVTAKSTIDNWSIYKKHCLVSGLALSTPAMLHKTPQVYDYITTPVSTAEPLFAEATNTIIEKITHGIAHESNLPIATEMPAVTGTPIAPWYQLINYSDTDRQAFIVKNSEMSYSNLGPTHDIPLAVAKLESAISTH